MKPLNPFLSVLLILLFSCTVSFASLGPNTSPLTMERDPGFVACETVEIVTYHPPAPENQICASARCQKPAYSGWVFGVFCAIAFAGFGMKNKR